MRTRPNLEKPLEKHKSKVVVIDLSSLQVPAQLHHAISASSSRRWDVTEVGHHGVGTSRRWEVTEVGCHGGGMLTPPVGGRPHSCSPLDTHMAR